MMTTSELLQNPGFFTLIDRLAKKFPTETVFTKPCIFDAANGIESLYPALIYRELMNADRRVSRGRFSLQDVLDQYKTLTPIQTEETLPPQMEMAAPAPKMIYSNNENTGGHHHHTFEPSANECFVPEVDKSFVSWGNFSDIKRIIKSGEFFPVYISGMSGNGKTVMVEQACAQLKREYIRVQISSETSESDLIGGFRLVNGNTVWQDSSVIAAMKAGAICLIDELDRGSAGGLMSLQGILEGKPVLIKATGELVHPKPGFNIIATANSKARGDDTGRYNFAQIIDEALLERFPVDIEQEFPKKDILKIMFSTYVENNRHKFSNKKVADTIDTFCSDLAAWGEIINTSFVEEAIEETISVRRLVHVLKTFGIFGGFPLKSIKFCINRFDPVNQEAFIDLYRKVTALELVDANASGSEPSTTESTESTESN